MPNEPGLLEGESVQEAQPVTEAPVQVEPKYATLEDVQRLATDAENRVYARAQSLVDKSSNRLNEQINQRFEGAKLAYKMTGQELTPELEARMRSNIVMQSLTSPVESDQSTTPTAPAQVSGGAKSEFDPIAAAAIKMAEKVGGFEPTDPEYAVVSKGGEMAPHEWLALVAEQVQAKSNRLASVKTRNPGSTVISVGSGGTVPSNDISQITDSTKLYDIGEQRLRRKS